MSTGNGVTLISNRCYSIVGEHMGKYVTVSTKVPKELKKKLEELNIKPSPLIKKALIEAIREAELRRLESEWERISPILDKIPAERIAKTIREERNAR